jgi:heat shock protein HslJ
MSASPEKKGATAWVLQKGRDIPSAPARKPTLRIEGDKLSGSTGCNNFTATVMKRDGTRVAIEQVATTRMLCEPAQNQIEVAFVAALRQTEFMTEQGTTLTFSSAEKAALLVWKRQRAASAGKHRRQRAAQLRASKASKAKRMQPRKAVYRVDCFLFRWR